MEFRLTLPKEASKLIAVIENAGYEAYAVGGCVRDVLLGRVPTDWDITTSATPEQVKDLFSHTVDTGIAHGTVTVLMNRRGFEVTTYRIDGAYEDCRHPKEVTFTRSLAEDLKRRDFTVNAMAYNEKTGLVDLFGGCEDLQRGVIRAVGNPRERFSEDALRIFRAIRFAAQLGFTIEPETERAMGEAAANLQAVSAERIREELTKLLGSDHPEELIRASELGLTAYWLPEFDIMLATPQENIHHIYDVGRHTIKSICALHESGTYQNADRHTRAVLDYTMLLHDCAKPECKTYHEDGSAHFKGHGKASAKLARGILRRLKFDNETVDLAEKLIANHDSRLKLKGRKLEHVVRRDMNRIGAEHMPLLYAIQRSDAYAQAPAYLQGSLLVISRMEEACGRIIEEGQCVNMKMLAVKGADLIALGYAPGPRLGEVLEMLLEDVLEFPEHNTKEYLLEKAHKYQSEG